MILKRIFEPVQIGTLHLPNRIVMAPMFSQFASAKGEVTDRMLHYYKKRAESGVGLLMVETTCVDYPLGTFTRELRLDDDIFVPRLAEMVSLIHSYNTKVSIQLHHAGRQTYVAATGGLTPVGPSEVPSGTPGLLSRALTIDEIKTLVRKFAEAAERAKNADFDAIEIHGSHGYLIAQFLSPFTNKRTDEYGGNLDKRLRFALDIVSAIRARVGTDFPLIFRINGSEFIEGGMAIDESSVMATRLEEAGIDAIHVSAGLRERGYWYEQPMYLPRGCLVDLAAKIKKKVGIPVIAVGRINDVFLAEQILNEKKADLVAMGRAFLADPLILRKAANGDFDGIRKCIACVDGCIENLFRHKAITCSINPEVGMEQWFQVKQADKKKTIVVVGGGPAGMEAGLIASQRGHKVILFEKEKVLGGQLNIAHAPPGKTEIGEIKNWLVNQITRAEIDVRLGKKASTEDVLAEKPDAVIVATGGETFVPQIPGINKKIVVHADDLLSGREKLEDGTIIVIGAGMVGCEMADYASEKRKEVTLVARRRCGHDVPARMRPMLFQRLEEKGVNMLKGLELREIKENSVVLSDINDSSRKELHADQVIMAVGYKPNDELVEELTNKSVEVHVIGDCFKPRKLLNAIHEGYRTALNI